MAQRALVFAAIACVLGGIGWLVWENMQKKDMTAAQAQTVLKIGDLELDLLSRTVKRGGILVIPAFAVGRTQALLHFISELRKARAIPDVPVYLNSPLGIDATLRARRLRMQGVRFINPRPGAIAVDARRADVDEVLW